MAASIAFVRLTDARDGSQVWVNFNHVWKFLKGAHGGTVIYLVPDTGGELWNCVSVKEEPDEIARRLPVFPELHNAPARITRKCEIPQ